MYSEAYLNLGIQAKSVAANRHLIKASLIKQSALLVAEDFPQVRSIGREAIRVRHEASSSIGEIRLAPMR